MKFNPLARIRFISVCIFAFAILLIVRLYILQIVERDTYVVKADRQYTSASTNVFSRGTIFFQNKDGTLVSAATLESGFVVAISPQILKDPEAAYAALNALVPVDHDSFMAKAAKAKDPYEEILPRVSQDIGTKIGALNITGLSVYKTRWRFYPGGAAAAHVVGILGYKGNDYAGRYGLERQYDTELQRVEGAYVNFFAQLFSDIQMTTQGTAEADVVTTIEPTVETALQNVLASTTEKWGSDMSGGIIMDPKTGEILAMESYPTFDPNHPEQQKSSAVFSNPLVENVYEFGSIIKPLTISAGIDTGVITASSTYYDNGFVIINNKKISNFDGKARGLTTIQDVLSQSLNVGAAHVESLLGDKVFTNYMYAFGVTEKTGIELPNEAKNLVDNLKSPRQVEHATASFGQGIALSPVSAIRALAAVANGGTLIQPHVVKQVNYTTGITSATKIDTTRRVIQRSTSEELSRMLTYSVDNVLAGGTLKLPNYSITAKTGTAQIPNPQGGYYTDKVLHSFVGYFPSYNPRFIILLFMVNPHGAQYASETLPGPYMDLVKFLINYYEIPPDR